MGERGGGGEGKVPHPHPPHRLCTSPLPVKHPITIQDGGIENMIHQAFRSKITPALQAILLLFQATLDNSFISLAYHGIKNLGPKSMMEIKVTVLDSKCCAMTRKLTLTKITAIAT